MSPADDDEKPDLVIYLAEAIETAIKAWTGSGHPNPPAADLAFFSAYLAGAFIGAEASKDVESQAATTATLTSVAMQGLFDGIREAKARAKASTAEPAKEGA